MWPLGKTPGTKGAHDPKKVKNDDNFRHFARQNPCFKSHSSRKQGKCIVVTPGVMSPRKKTNKKKKTRQEGDASILLPRGYRNLVSQVPLPMTDNDEEDALQN